MNNNNQTEHVKEVLLIGKRATAVWDTIVKTEYKSVDMKGSYTEIMSAAQNDILFSAIILIKHYHFDKLDGLVLTQASIDLMNEFARIYSIAMFYKDKKEHTYADSLLRSSLHVAAKFVETVATKENFSILEKS